MAAPRTHAKLAFLTGRPRVQTQWVWGPAERRRWAIFGAKLGIFLGLPWLTIGGVPALLFDIPARRYHVFGQVFWPQDMYVLGLVLAVAAVLLFATSALVGRVFCGHACPHTLMTSLFMAVDHLIEGDRVARLAIDAGQAGWRGRARRAVKHAVWVAIAAGLGFTFTSYFYGAQALAADALAGQVTGAGLASWVAIATLVYVFAGHLRDFICTTTCPYGRFQGAMQDPRSLVVAYDAERGEPRGKGAAQAARGGCVDCGMCVTACPMGIDVRDGLQYECITCMRCVDACNHMMGRIGAAPDLIRLAATNSGVNPDAPVAPVRQTRPTSARVGPSPSAESASGAGNTLTSPEANQYKSWRPRPRLAWYGLVLAGLAGAIAWLVLTRPLLGLAVSRDGRAAFALPGDQASNLYELRLTNKDVRPHALAIALVGLDGRLVMGENPLTVAPGEMRLVKASVVAPATAGAPRPFRFRLVDLDGRTVRGEAAATFVPPPLR